MNIFTPKLPANNHFNPFAIMPLPEVNLSVRVANTSALTNKELLESLKANVEKAEFYEFVPTPGVIYASAGFWEMITHAGDLAGIAAFLWQLYESRIKPKIPPDSTANEGIVINVEVNGNKNNVWIGGAIKSEEELATKIKEILAQPIAEPPKVEKSIRKRSSNWKRTK